MDYKKAGVDIEAGYKSVELMKDYVKQTGWVQVGDTWYYMDASGAMVSNTEMVIDGKTYKFDESGAMV